MKLRPLLPWGAVASVLALLLVVGGADSVRATSFNPTLSVEIDDNTPEVSSNYTVNFGLPSGDVNFAAVVAYIPPEWGVVTGDNIPIGTVVGNLSSKATLGLINGACNTEIPVDFEFMNGSLDREDTVSFLDTDENGTGDYADDKDGNGLFDAVDRYPEFLNRLFPDLQPIRRSVGVTPVAGIPILLQFLIFPPGTQINPAIDSSPELGYPSVTVLQNAGDPEAVPRPSPITDFCTPLESINVSLGTAADGTQLFVNPQNGTYDFQVIALGLRDADGDGFENSLDTCPFTPNEGDPRVLGDGDADPDGLDAACDPNDDNPSSDEDGDGYQNRGDNCPLVANGEDLDNQEDGDLDQIGDACDPAPEEPDGELSSAQPVFTVTIGDGTGPGGPPAECPGCYVASEAPSPGEDGDREPGAEDGDGVNTGVVVGIVVGVIAAIVIIGGGAFVLMRRGGA